MKAPIISFNAVHFFSQLIYLDTVPAMRINGGITVGAIVDYYSKSELGAAYLASRFGDIPQEYAQWVDLLKYPPQELLEWRAVDILDYNQPTQSGFYGCTFLGSTGERVIAFRGSELLGNRYYRNDYMTDFALSYQVPTPQQEDVLTYWSRFARSDYSEGLAITGHSLGGNLAVFAAIHAPPVPRAQMQVCAAFNAPGFCEVYLEKNEAIISGIAPRLKLYQNKYDLVSSLLHNAVSPVIVASAFIPGETHESSSLDIFYPHSNFAYKTDDQGEFILEEEGEKSRFCTAVEHFSSAFMGLPKQLRKELAELIITVIYREPSEKKATRYQLEALLKTATRSSATSTLGGLDAVAVLFAAKMLPHDSPQKLYHSIETTETSRTNELASTLLVLLDILKILRNKIVRAK